MFAVKRPAAWSLASRAWQANVTRSRIPPYTEQRRQVTRLLVELTLLKAKADRK